MKLIEDYNIDRKTFEWGGKELLPKREFINLTGFSEEYVNILLDKAEEKEQFQEHIDFILMEKRDLELIVQPDRVHIFDNMCDEDLEACFDKHYISCLLSVHVMLQLEEWFSPFNKVEIQH